MADYIDALMLSTSAKLRKGKYSDDDLSRLRKLAEAGAYDAAAVSDAVFFPVVASANTVDSYGTFMLPSTLKNFANNATEGVAVLDSHNARRLNFGMSVTGEYVEEGDLRYMRSDFYTIPGMKTEGLDTDTYIKGVQAGLFRDVSVGFWMPPGAETRCTICGKDMMRWWKEDGCSHFPGLEYEIPGEGTTRVEVAYGAIDGAALSEYSLVPDGATPGAGVAKARNMEENGELAPETALRLERAYHTTFPRATRMYRGALIPAGDKVMTAKDKVKREPLTDDTADDENTQRVIEGDEVINPDVNIEPTVITPLVDDEPESDDPEGDEQDDDDNGERAIEKSGLRFTKGLREALNEKYEDAGIKFGERVSDAVVALADEVKRLGGQLATEKESKRQLEDEAKIGRTYRADLIKELKSEIIRAADATEDKEAKVARYERLAESADVETIKGLRDDFAAAARAKYGTGRRSLDNEQGDSKSKPAVLPETAYDDL